MSGVTRPESDLHQLTAAFTLLDKMTRQRLQEKGPGIYAGPHEAYGIIAEEVQELLQALVWNNREMFRSELVDIAVACLVALASVLPDDTSAEVVQ